MFGMQIQSDGGFVFSGGSFMPSQATQVNEGGFSSVRVSGFPLSSWAILGFLIPACFGIFKSPMNLDCFVEKRYRHRASYMDSKTDKPGNLEALG